MNIPAPKASAPESRELETELKKRLSGEVRFDKFSRILYSTDASIYQMEPLGVVLPRGVEDVLAVVEIARNYRVPILPRGAGTSLSGQTVNRAIVLDFSRHMSGILEVNPQERWARVEPGVVLDQLNGHVAPLGLKFAPDPTTANRACIGGAIGNNSCGAHSVVYGKTIDHVQELQAILADGTLAHLRPLNNAELEEKLAGAGLQTEVYRQVLRIAQENHDEVLARFPKIMRRVSGYNLDAFIPTNGGARRPFNLARMVVGSEGTLCVVTEAKVGLAPVPAAKGLALLHFAHMAEGCDAVPEILRHQPAAVEMIGRMILDLCRESLGSARLLRFIEGQPDALLAVEFTAQSGRELAARLADFKRDMEGKRLGYACVLLEGPSQNDVWELRSAGLGLLMSIRGDAKPLPYVEDTAVDPQKLGHYVRRFDEIVKAHDTSAGYYGHASVGCLHIRPLVNLKTREGIRTMASIASAVSDLVLEFGGSLSGEHGDGIVRGVWTEKLFGPKLYRAFQEIKRAFDPQNIMNPGKIVDCPPMMDNLRFGEGYKATTLSTKLDFSTDWGYSGAVEMCNGMGACRKDAGTMCPSFMATREEEHSTRGRANLLRAALSGALPPETLTSQRLYEALDLCLECKGCKAECQAGVDMAKLKAEFLDKHNEAHGVSLRSLIFANINALSRLGAACAPPSNWAASNPLTKLLFHQALGVHRKRPLPPFARPSFPAWLRARGPSPEGRLGTVVLFNDTFMNYSYPQIGIAAVEVLEQAGFRVALANGRCCGRPMISKGLLDRATKHARDNVDLLYPYVEQGIPIVGCEPSCLLTFRDEYPDLLRDDKAKTVARNSFLIDEFLSRLLDEGRLQLEFDSAPRKILFHPHCHQKALVGSHHSLRLLRLPPGHMVETPDAGCCGMAGAFGYEKEHYELSMAIGRQRLFPAIESRGADWEVAVTGISCLQQVQHGTARKPRHLVEVLREALKG